MTIQNIPALDWTIQTTEPTPDRVGLFASTEEARRTVAGRLLALANAWPDNDDQPRVDDKVIIDHDKQTAFCWIAHQLLGMKSLQVTVTILAPEALPTLSIDTAGVVQIGIPQSLEGASYSLSLAE